MMSVFFDVLTELNWVIDDEAHVGELGDRNLRILLLDLAVALVMTIEVSNISIFGFHKVKFFCIM